MKRGRSIRAIAALMLIASMTMGLAACGSSQSESASKAVDIDLTTLSTTMLISEIANMVSSPEEYVGKRVKAVGLLNVLDYNDRKIFSCSISDPAGCCGQQLEFEREGDYTYPEDYPSPGSIIFVEGTFATYEEDGSRYCRLDDARLSTSKDE